MKKSISIMLCCASLLAGCTVPTPVTLATISDIQNSAINASLDIIAAEVAQVARI
jgi:hypothetical protein